MVKGFWQRMIKELPQPRVNAITAGFLIYQHN